jgi:carotenoid cleavage dioxygenase-like enzyme
LKKYSLFLGEVLTWAETNTFCSEPAFISAPGAVSEDDGVLITSLIRGKPDVTYTGLLVLDAKNLLELARVEFYLPGPVPKPLHGCYLASWDFKQS